MLWNTTPEPEALIHRQMYSLQWFLDRKDAFLLHNPLHRWTVQEKQEWLESLLNNPKQHHKSQQPIVLMLDFTPEGDREYTIVEGWNRCEALVEFLGDRLAVRASHVNVMKGGNNDGNMMKDNNIIMMNDENVMKGVIDVDANMMNDMNVDELKFSDLNLENPSVIRHVALPVEIFVPM